MSQIKLFVWELESMDEYSTSLPSAQTIGKMWRRSRRLYGLMRTGEREEWMVGQYARDDNPNLIRIRWLDVVLKEGPEPRNYHAPDWAKFERWKREKDRSLGCTVCGNCARV